MARELATAAATVLLAVLAAAALAAAGPEDDALLAFRLTLRGPNGGPPQELDRWLTTTLEPFAGGAGKSAWYGVDCDAAGRVSGLSLLGLGLEGPVPDLTPLAALPELTGLDLARNNLTGAFPDVSGLAALDSLFLQQNRLGGEIRDGAFVGTAGLRWLALSENELAGPIPSSHVTLPRLQILHLFMNRFEGRLPEFEHKHLTFFDVSNNNLSGRIPEFEGNQMGVFNVSYNDLSGPIPAALRRFDARSFQGNNGLCGPPLPAPCPIAPSPSPSSAPSPSP